MTDTQISQAILNENQHLRERLEELEETLRAIRSGEVDALVVTRPEGEQVYTLKGALEPYRVMVETMSEGAVTLAHDGAILYCNSRFAQLVKMPHEQIAGLPLHRWIAALDRDKFNRMLAQGSSNPVRDKLTMQADDASPVPVHFSMSPLPESEGKGIAVVITDLTEVVAAAEAKSRLALIVESSDDAILSTTPDGVVESWNAAAERLFGYTAKEAIGGHIQILIASPERTGEVAQNLDTIRRGGSVGHVETVRLRKDGTPIDVSLTVSPIKDAAGNIVGASAILRDITGRKQAEAELDRHRHHLEELVQERTSKLEAANQDLDGFAYSVSHDLRVPLRAVDGFANMLLKRYQDKLDDEGKRYLDVVRDNTRRMAQLIDDILAFSRMGRQGITMSEAHMEELAHAVLEELRPTFAGRDLLVEIKPLPSVHGDLAMLRQVWINLLTNAIKFTRPKPAARIEIEGKIEGAECIYRISDNGVGFDMQYAGKLFGVFQRLHSIEEFEGTGIGLAIVKRIIGRHGGRVWAEGKVNEGTVFYFSLPSK